MGRRRNKWSWKFWDVVASVATIIIARLGVTSGSTTPPLKNDRAPCSSSMELSHLMLVSTLDGKISALDLAKEGSLVWSMNTGSRPLLSSSISKLGIMRNGERTRLIPSLDGGVYQYNGESIEAVPFTAETLLSSSFKLNDNTVVVGGKELCTYGVEKESGQVRYRCSVRGCSVVGNEKVTEEEDILMITRNTHTVRAVDSRTGTERWNFSVGQHEVRIFEGVKRVIQTDAVDADDDDEDGISITTCQAGGEEAGAENGEFEGLLKVIVPRGIVLAVSKTDSNKVLWKQQFGSPIANAWTLRNGKLDSVNLFSEKTVPALSTSEVNDNELPPEPLLYVGVHHDQLYVQPSVKMKDIMTETTASSYRDMKPDTSSSVTLHLPRVTWKPYLATAFSRTPALRVGQGGANLPLLDGEPVIPEEPPSNAVSVWQDMYPYDGGCYLYPDFTPVLPIEDLSGPEELSNVTKPEENLETLTVTLWNWWKEVVAITVVTAVVVHILTHRYSQRSVIYQVSLSDKKSEEKSYDKVTDEEQNTKGPQDQSEYISRYYTDFEHIRCLGKGGFGIVFEAKNKMDECPYAVKRISLTNSETAKERVMREVKALAKLDHNGIVRYYQAWLESPPVGWQEEKDCQLEDSECLTPTPCNSGADLYSDRRSLPFINPLHPPEVLSHHVDITSDMSMSREEGSGGFIPKVSEPDEDESGSFSIGTGTPQRHSFIPKDDSFEVVFDNSQTNDSESGGGDMGDLIYSGDTNQSFSIVFEDSGCGDGQVKINNPASLFRGKSETCSGFSEDVSAKSVAQSFTEGTCSTPKKSNHFSAPKLYLFIQMQLCQRETLKDWLMANTLNRDRHTLLDIFDQIVMAVQYVHDGGLMHRDLKPSNIFFSTEGVVKIGDFGLVTALSEQDDSTVSVLSGEGTEENHTAQVGTQLYMSPEQVSGKSYGQKVDIYSLGVILFELLFPFATQMERIRTLQDVRRHNCPDRFKREMPLEHDFVTWLLDKNPEKRPTARKILSSSLLEEFAPRHQAHYRVRSRTISSESNGSKGNGS